MVGELDVCSLIFVRGRMEVERTGEEATRGPYFISDPGVTVTQGDVGIVGLARRLAGEAQRRIRIAEG